MLTQAEIEGRRTSYACCAFDYLVNSVNAEVKGKNKAANENFEKALYMYWAALVMGGTPIDSDENPGCYTVLFATEVAQRADCLCDGCACKPSTPPFDASCDVVINYTVLDAIPQDNLPPLPAVGDAYYIIAAGANLGEIATWDGAQWVFTTIPLFSVVWSVDDANYYTNFGGGPGYLFPAVEAVFVDFVNQYTIQSKQPQIATGSTRLISLNGYVNGVWTIFYSGTEDSIATPLLFEFGSLPITALQVQYNVGDCFSTSPGSVVPGFQGCGTVDITITPQSNCSSDTFNLDVDIQNQFAWPIGGITPIVNTVTQPTVPAGPGINTVGPFGLDDAVSLIVVNANNTDCNFSNGTSYFDPRLPSIDFRVFMAVDASYETDALPNTRYLIVSNVDSVVNTWSTHVGEIAVGDGTFQVPLAGNVTRADFFSSGIGYWETIAGPAQVEIYPAVVQQFNTVTEVFVALPPAQIAPLAAGLTIIVRWKCPSSSDELIFVGLIEDFVETPFAPICAIPNVTGDITYFTGSCPITVPAVVTEFTPTGDPDPDFGVGGPNSAVYDLVIAPDTQNAIIGGAFTAWTYGGTPPDITGVNRVCQVSPDGDIDLAYQAALGTGFDDIVFALAIDAQSRVYAGGNFGLVDGNVAIGLARLTPLGAYDPTFDTGTGFTLVGNPGSIRDMIVLSDGSLICVGDFDTYKGQAFKYIVKIDANGDPDLTFQTNIGTGFNQLTFLVVEDPSDGSIVVGKGFFSSFNGTGTGGIVRLEGLGATCGTLVGTVTTGAINQPLAGISIQPDGKLVVTGNFTQYGTPPPPTGYRWTPGAAPLADGMIMRIGPTGVMDATFFANSGTAFGPTAAAWATKSLVMANGQIVVGVYDPGIPTTYNGVDVHGLARLNSDGTLDTTFNTGAGPNLRVTCMGQDALGRIVVAGLFTSWDGQPRYRIARLN